MEFRLKDDTESMEKAYRLVIRNSFIASLVLYSLIFLFGVIVAILSFIDTKYQLSFGFVVALFGIAGFVLKVIRVNKSIRMNIQVMEESFGGKSSESILKLADEEMSVKYLANQNVFKTKYNDIAYCMENKDVILFMSNQRQFIFISKKELNELDTNKITDFIKSKNIKYKKVR